LAIDLINLLTERRIFTPDLGRIDMTVLAAGAVWVFEFKVVELVPQGRALAQIRDRGHADKYRDRGGLIKVRG
jgi:hypothetical protein